MIIDGKAIAAEIRQEISEEVRIIRENGLQPGLAVILVGEDPASQVYVRMKAKACEKAGIHSITDRLPATISEAELLEKVEFYNNSPDYHGILVQLPLPKHIDEQKIIEAIRPEKDVDCFHPYNVGRLSIGQPIFEPATPAGIVELLHRSKVDTHGKHVVVLGRSNIVGKPVAMLLVQKNPKANAIVTIVHTAAEDLAHFTRQADILIAAVGRPQVVTADMVKDGVVVIDVGVNRIDADNEKGYALVGDVDFEGVAPKAAAITPVPGGVGPMTIAMLLKNTLKAFQLQQKDEA
ncbi:MAG: bifunctional methylenetetrahydrofolate dehydrogenase/methenyltetrahydrofolate cyclohydrolase FolD [Calditrichia bacterium]